ncbi:MAG: hypothetical protein COB02_09665 [Candidatus Cloacimonadota bacterium]|nr:MAG: hypothetical protein COB02_09665 [Candidatus Cloacimonadota bacterium]
MNGDGPLKGLLEQILKIDDEDNQEALQADRKSQIIYSRIKEIVVEKDVLKENIDQEEIKDTRLKLQLCVMKLDREFNELLNVLAMQSMDF